MDTRTNGGNRDGTLTLSSVKGYSIHLLLGQKEVKDGKGWIIQKFSS